MKPLTVNSDEIKRQRIKTVIILYPMVLVFISAVLNWLLGVQPFVLSLPTVELTRSLIIVACLLVANHSWLMTQTELTRLRYKLYATAEEWQESGYERDKADKLGLQEVERCQNAHHNTTENSVYFVLLSLLVLFVSPTLTLVNLWLYGFAVARLGYTFSYLAGKVAIRGICMSISLLSMYGLASYLLLSFIM